MPIGFSSSSSSQRTQSVSDSGQLIERGSRTAQGGGTLLEKNASIGQYNLSHAKIGKGASVTFGPTGEDLQTLVGDVTRANAAQIAALSASGAQQMEAAQGTTAQLVSGLSDKFTGLLSQKTDTEAGNPKSMLWLGLAALAAMAFAWRK
jgi:hypothetical protein